MLNELSFPQSDIASILPLLIPGFVALGVRSQFIRGFSPSQSKENFVIYLAFSSVYDTLVVRFIEPEWMTDSTIWFLVIFITVPAIIGLLLGINVQRNFIRGALGRIGIYTTHAFPTAWDWVFSRAVSEEWVLVTLKNGVQFSGLFGLESFAASSPNERDLYIQWLYDIDEEGNWDPVDEKGSGVLISASEISTVEFWPVETNEEQK